MSYCCGRRGRYKLATKAEIKLDKLATGDLVFFSDNWSNSSVGRKIRNINGRLWTSGGIVIRAPELYGPEPLLFEFMHSYPDDLLEDKLTNKQVNGGVRLVSLAARMRQSEYSACMVRKIQSAFVRQTIADTNTKVCSALVKGMSQHSFANSAHMIYNALNNAGVLEVKANNGVLLSDCTNDAINVHSCDPRLYSKGKIYQVN